MKAEMANGAEQRATKGSWTPCSPRSFIWPRCGTISRASGDDEQQPAPVGCDSCEGRAVSGGDGVSNYLPDEEQAKLALAAQGGDTKSRDRLVETSQGLVHDVAKKYLGGGMELEDLVNEGNIGLLKGVEKFDPEKANFATCAYVYVRAFSGRASGRTASAECVSPSTSSRKSQRCGEQSGS